MKKRTRRIISLTAIVAIFLVGMLTTKPAIRVAKSAYQWYADIAPEEDYVPAAYAYDPYAMTPEQLQGEQAQRALHNAYVRRIVQGGHLSAQEKKSLDEDEVADIYCDVAGWRAREAERLAEIRAENPPEYVIPQDNTVLGTGVH